MYKRQTLTRFTRWLSVGATLAAVAEHGYQELHARGSFDPEVMSVVYLINSIGKTNGMQASALAWALTFGRHLIPQEPREQVYICLLYTSIQHMAAAVEMKFGCLLRHLHSSFNFFRFELLMCVSGTP